MIIDIFDRKCVAVFHMFYSLPEIIHKAVWLDYGRYRNLSGHQRSRGRPYWWEYCLCLVSSPWRRLTQMLNRTFSPYGANNHFLSLFFSADSGKQRDVSPPAATPGTTLIQRTCVTIKNFIFHKVLGKGSFGKVCYLANVKQIDLYLCSSLSCSAFQEKVPQLFASEREAILK